MLLPRSLLQNYATIICQALFHNLLPFRNSLLLGWLLRFWGLVNRLKEIMLPLHWAPVSATTVSPVHVRMGTCNINEGALFLSTY